MILDKNLEFAVGQVLTAAAASTNVLDLGVAGDAYGHELYCVVRVGTALASAGHAATLQIKFQTATDAAFTSPITLVEGPAIAEASLTANSEQFKVKVPQGLKRYIRVYFTVAVESFTSGTVDAFLTPDVKLGSA